MPQTATQGFSLIELLTVIASIGILAAILIPNLISARNKANDQAAIAYLRHCVTSIEMVRKPGTLALPDGITHCRDDELRPAAMGEVSAVRSDRVDVDPTTGQYTIEVVSAAGKTFHYDGKVIVF
ncbi:pilin, type IV, putative [Deinococcus proteolyticus MRP]|uniref:Pilin, type IV, putative n=1 Tax=Deinococcus proteolyticus (strain ATCC 35074 / DSM 20540 / JCM 6276 / NBRC 101906 / NCIMB 13154 / VKM Ac-1939 / CCM 2703 / MRP) TaxID=693977 RepID=F0RLM0_DEIPM|nr:prepilin-type N-terminal cleavage/methylation domain-containing protein [Deinococcus proteolyticus]ADY26944.1 pilin, type IV, putative [Deinococcus proteolyticus MRP]